MSALLIGPNELEALHDLRNLAAQHPVNILELLVKIETPAGKIAHMEQMSAQSVIIPLDHIVTYSVETHHPAGTCRHLSLSSARDRLPAPAEVWAVALEMGFGGSVWECEIWLERLLRTSDERTCAINLVQPVLIAAGHA